MCRQIRCLVLVLAVCFVTPRAALCWGWHVHHLINGSATLHLPEEFQAFAQWREDLERLSTAADLRQASDPNEAIRHYIDIDMYDAFLAGTFPHHTYEEMVAQFGRDRVQEIGILPWAIEETRLRLVTHMRDGDWTQAVAAAADLGHYVADCHQPLHLTQHYDGDGAEQRGIHSRYESVMTEMYFAELDVESGRAYAYPRPLEVVFNAIESVYHGVYLVLNADFKARDAAGGNRTSPVYYNKLWSITGAATQRWIRDASLQTAALWYTAWLDAGAPRLPGSETSWRPARTLELLPNVPNPFNPSTTIRFETPQPGSVALRVFDVQGRLVRQLFQGIPGAGERSVTWDGRDENRSRVASGVYRIRLEQGDVAVERRAVVVR